MKARVADPDVLVGSRLKKRSGPVSNIKLFLSIKGQLSEVERSDPDPFLFYMVESGLTPPGSATLVALYLKLYYTCIIIIIFFISPL